LRRLFLVVLAPCGFSHGRHTIPMPTKAKEALSEMGCTRLPREKRFLSRAEGAPGVIRLPDALLPHPDPVFRSVPHSLPRKQDHLGTRSSLYLWDLPPSRWEPYSGRVAVNKGTPHHKRASLYRQAAIERKTMLKSNVKRSTRISRPASPAVQPNVESPSDTPFQVIGRRQI
jgi:hypothetical protein